MCLCLVYYVLLCSVLCAVCVVYYVWCVVYNVSVYSVLCVVC